MILEGVILRQFLRPSHTAVWWIDNLTGGTNQKCIIAFTQSYTNDNQLKPIMGETTRTNMIFRGTRGNKKISLASALNQSCMRLLAAGTVGDKGRCVII